MDRDLVTRAQDGDRQAFGALVAGTHPRLYRVALGILRDHSAAEDATQQALIDIWRHLPRLRDPSKFASWSYKILVRACAAHIRARRRWSSQDDLRLAEEPGDSGQFAAVDDRDQLERALQQLSIDHRAVIVMRYLLDMPEAQVAAALDVSTGTVASRLNRARSALRASLEADDRPTQLVTEARASER
jgi:RNA polymerase sigma-70 factor (ECF subfamily)